MNDKSPAVFLSLFSFLPLLIYLLSVNFSSLTLPSVCFQVWGSLWIKVCPCMLGRAAHSICFNGILLFCRAENWHNPLKINVLVSLCKNSFIFHLFSCWIRVWFVLSLFHFKTKSKKQIIGFGFLFFCFKTRTEKQNNRKTKKTSFFCFGNKNGKTKNKKNI